VAPTPPPDFEIRFRYRSAVGEEKRRLVANLGLEELQERVLAVRDRKSLGLGSGLCLEQLHLDEPLTYLVIEETGTTGMYGPWRGSESRLYRALLTLGYTKPPGGGEGGSYGYGKAGLIAASSTRSLFTYTCFLERPDDPGVTRRALGMTYWGQHSSSDGEFTGFARLGKRQSNTANPFENEEADAMASCLGLQTRDHRNAEEIGTTILLVEPLVQPQDLERAVCRAWWPALEEGGLHVVIETDDGETIHPRPRSDRSLAPFLEAYEAARQQPDVSQANVRRHVLQAAARKTRVDDPVDGVLGLVADPEGWSYPRRSDPAENGESCSLVALMRQPRMVVEYLPHAPGTVPVIYGAFVAAERVNERLRQTEPKGHDAWRTKPDSFSDPDAFDLAASINDESRATSGSSAEP